MTQETRASAEAPDWERDEASKAFDHSLNALDCRQGQLLRVEHSAGEPRAISAHVGSYDLHRAKAGADRGAKRALVFVENDG